MEIYANKKPKRVEETLAEKIIIELKKLNTFTKRVAHNQNYLRQHLEDVTARLDQIFLIDLPEKMPDQGKDTDWWSSPEEDGGYFAKNTNEQMVEDMEQTKEYWEDGTMCMEEVVANVLEHVIYAHKGQEIARLDRMAMHKEIKKLKKKKGAKDKVSN